MNTKTFNAILNNGFNPVSGSIPIYRIYQINFKTRLRITC